MFLRRVLQVQDKVSETFWSRFKFKSLFTTMGILKLYPICFCAVDYRQIHNTCRCDDDDDVNLLSLLQALLQCRSCIPVSRWVFLQVVYDFRCSPIIFELQWNHNVRKKFKMPVYKFTGCILQWQICYLQKSVFIFAY